jgi:recombination protein RecT
MENNKLSVGNNERMKTLRGLIESARGEIAKVLPSHMTVDRQIKIALVGAYKNPKLLLCTPASMLTALMNASELGLEPFTGLQQAYIIPYKNNKTGQYEAKFEASYRGLLDICRRSGDILSIDAQCVYERDSFECQFGLNPILKHVPNFDGKDRGKIILAFAVARLKDGGFQSDIMTDYDLDKVRRSSKSPNDGPWVNWYPEMCRKSVLRRLIKYLPVSVNIAKAVSLDNNDTNEEVYDVDNFNVDSMLEPEHIEESKADSLAKKIENLAGTN